MLGIYAPGGGGFIAVDAVDAVVGEPSALLREQRALANPARRPAAAASAVKSTGEGEARREGRREIA